MTDLKLNPRIKPSPYTGSAFDTTITMNIIERPGGHHHGPTVDINVGAFSHCKKTHKSDPTDFTKKGTGHGGTVTVCAIFLDSFSPHRLLSSHQKVFLMLLHQRNIIILTQLLHQELILQILS
jgi:hypothetical protein